MHGTAWYGVACMAAVVVYRSLKLHNIQIEIQICCGKPVDAPIRALCGSKTNMV